MVRAWPVSQHRNFRAAIIVPQRVAKKAVVRNRIRRVLMGYLGKLSFAQDIVVAVRNIPASHTNAVMRKELAMLLERLAI